MRKVDADGWCAGWLPEDSKLAGELGFRALVCEEKILVSQFRGRVAHGATGGPS